MPNYAFRTLATLQAPSVTVEVREHFIAPTECLVLPPLAYHLVGVLGGLPRPTQGRYGDGRQGGFTNIGEVFFTPADLPWQVRSGGGRLRSVTCVLEPELVRDLIGRDRDWDERELIACHDIPDTRIRQSLERLGEEAVSPGPGSGVAADALGRLMLVDLGRYLHQYRGAPPAGRGLEPWQLRRLREYLHGLSGVRPDTARMAALCGMSQRSLERRFRASSGESLGRYIQRFQLNRACQWLAEGTLGLDAIAKRLGFSSAANFGAAFRRHSGRTPGQYRREYRAAMAAEAFQPGSAPRE